MPTFQTTPSMPWVFPDDAIRMNKSGVGMGPAVLPNQTMLIGVESAWAAIDRATALARVRNTELAKSGMLGHRNTTARSQRYERPASRSAYENGMFPGEDYVTAAGMLRGGTGLITPEGRAWGKKKLEQRVEELNAIESQDYTKGNPNKSIDLTPNTNGIESTLFQFIDQFEAGAFSSSMIESANRLQQAFITEGWALTASLISTYLDILRNLQDQAERMVSVGGGVLTMKEEKKNIARALTLTFERLINLLEEIAKFVNEDPESRKRLVKSAASRLLPNMAGFATGIGSDVKVRREAPGEGQTTYETVRAGTVDVRRRRPTAAEMAIYMNSRGPLPPAYYDPQVGFIL